MILVNLKKMTMASGKLQWDKNTSGFTLLEVMVALSILAIGILGLAKMQMWSIQGNDTAWNFTTGATGGADRIEALIGLAYDDPAISNGIIIQGKHTITSTISLDDPIPNVKKITMVVTWNDKGQNRSFTTDYYKAVTF